MNPESLINSLRETDFYIEKIYLNGGCYQFYKFLKSVYPEAKAYLNPDKDHVVTKIKHKYYDITGEVKGDFLQLTEQDVKMCEKWSFKKNNWLIKMCIKYDVIIGVCIMQIHKYYKKILKVIKVLFGYHKNIHWR